MAELRNGWEPDTPVDDLLLRQAVFNFTDFNAGCSEALGARVRWTDSLALADLGKPGAFMNNATFLRPIEPEHFDKAADEVAGYFDGRGSGDVEVWSAWPTPNMTERGWELGGHPPMMFRAVANDTRELPEELVIEQVRDENGVRDFERVLSTSFGHPDAPSVFDDRILSLDGTKLWVGYVDGAAVATAAVSTTRGVNGVQTIATLPERRGHGYGEAMTWVATRADPSKPAVLLASDLGRPVYERMGYVALLRFSYWRIPRP